jgi:hypothetical protein
VVEGKQIHPFLPRSGAAAFPVRCTGKYHAPDQLSYIFDKAPPGACTAPQILLY